MRGWSPTRKSQRTRAGDSWGEFYSPGSWASRILLAGYYRRLMVQFAADPVTGRACSDCSRHFAVYDWRRTGRGYPAVEQVSHIEDVGWISAPDYPSFSNRAITALISRAVLMPT